MEHLAAEGALAEGPQTLLQVPILDGCALYMTELCVEAADIPKDEFVNDADEAIEFLQRVLERGGRE